MAKFTSYYHFATPGLWLKAELLGKSYDFELESHKMTLTIPKDENDFELASFTPRTDERVFGRSKGVKGDEKQIVEVLMVRVGVDITTDFDIEAGSTDSSKHAKLWPYLSKGNELANQLIKEYLDTVAIEGGQYWLILQSQEPERAWMNLVYDEEGNRVRTSAPQAISVTLLGDAPLLNAKTQRQMVDYVRSGATLPLAENFLRDARYLQSHNVDPAQTILFTAISCEIKIKSTLRELANNEQAALVSLILENPRDVSIAAASLLDKGLLAVVGKSLRLEDKPLYKAACSLFEDRNALAHSGKIPSKADNQRHISTAVGIFDWLNSLTKS